MNHSPTPSTVCLSGNSSTTNSVNSGRKCEGRTTNSLLSVRVHTHCTDVDAHACEFRHMQGSVCRGQRTISTAVFLRDIHLVIVLWFLRPKRDTLLVGSLPIPSWLSWLPRNPTVLASTGITCANHHTPHHCMNLRDQTHSHPCMASI